MPPVTFTWTEAEAEALADRLQGLDIYDEDDPFRDLKERFYKVTGRESLLNDDGTYPVNPL